MGKDMVAVLSRQLKNYRPKNQPVEPHLGFANEYEEQLFRAFAAVHPKKVRIADAGWRLYADEHVKLGYASCAIDGAEGAVLAFSFVALLGLSPASAFAGPVLSGAYTLSAHEDCSVNGYRQPDFNMIGKIVFAPSHTDSSRGAVNFFVVRSYPEPRTVLNGEYGSGTYRITQSSGGNGLGWILWRWGTHQPPMSLIFGRVQDGIAQSAEAIGYKHGCSQQVSLTRIGL